MKWQTLVLTLAILVSGWMISNGGATITVPYTFTPYTTISSSNVNSNFSTIAEAALNRHGDSFDGTLAGTTAGKLSTLNTTATSIQTAGGVTTGTLVTTNTGAASATIGGGITAGTGSVAIISEAGKIPAISSTYFANLNGANLTGIVPWTATTKTTTYGAAEGDFVFANGTFTVTLPAASSKTKAIAVSNIGSGVVTVARTGSDTFSNGDTTQSLAPGDEMSFMSDGTSIWAIH